MVIQVVLIIAILNIFNVNGCSEIELQKFPRVNLTEYIRKTWYIQKQQINGYQPRNSLNCVLATYNIDTYSKVPFFNKTVLSVYNYANINGVNGLNENNGSILCARVKNDTQPEKLLVAPCFLPNLFGGPYWIVAAGPISNNYEWSIVIGGQPTVKYNDTCTTKEYGINNSGLWLLSRERQLNKTKLDYLYRILRSKNITTSRLLDVNQTGCSYNGAFIK